MNNYCIISHEYKFIYVPIAKVACTTILNRLAEIIHDVDLKAVMPSSHRDVHTRRKEVFSTRTSEISYDIENAFNKYKNYFKFAFVRNPFDRVHSCYVDKLSIDTYGFDNNLISKYSQMHRGMSFQDFLKTILTIPLEEMDEHFRPQFSFFPLNEVDFIGKIETLETDWKKIEEKIIKNTYKQLPVFNKTQEINYYDSETEYLALNIYARDFELFNYNTVRTLKYFSQRELPLTIATSSKDRLYPFKDVFLKGDAGAFTVTVTGDDPLLIIPYFSIRKDKHVCFNLNIRSSIDTCLTLFYTTSDAIDSPHSKRKEAKLSEGENYITFVLSENSIVGRIRLKISESPGVFKINKIEITEKTPPWLEDPADLTEVNKRLFSLPPYCQKQKNLFSMCNFASIYMPILNILKPKIICEIGCDQGNNTDLLIDFCNKQGAQLDIVDPTDLEISLHDSYSRIRHFKKKSIEFLSECRIPADVYFIDGDHNYKTVIRELQLIDGLTGNTKLPVCLFIHDISWPWAYRDLHYTPEDIGVDDDRIVSDKGVSLYSESPVEDGLPTLMKYAYSKSEGGEKNGVRKALEDFLEKCQTWKFMYIPSLYGLGIVWKDSQLTDKQRKVFDNVRSHIGFFKEFLSILEWNRLALYCSHHRNVHLWKEDQAYIKKLQQKLRLYLEELQMKNTGKLVKLKNMVTGIFNKNHT